MHYALRKWQQREGTGVDLDGSADTKGRAEECGIIAWLGRITFGEMLGYLFKEYGGDPGAYLDRTFDAEKLRRIQLQARSMPSGLMFSGKTRPLFDFRSGAALSPVAKIGIPLKHKHSPFTSWCSERSVHRA